MPAAASAGTNSASISVGSTRTRAPPAASPCSVSAMRSKPDPRPWRGTRSSATRTRGPGPSRRATAARSASGTSRGSVGAGTRASSESATPRRQPRMVAREQELLERRRGARRLGVRHLAAGIDPDLVARRPRVPDRSPRPRSRRGDTPGRTRRPTPTRRAEPAARTPSSSPRGAASATPSEDAGAPRPSGRVVPSRQIDRADFLHQPVAANHARAHGAGARPLRHRLEERVEPAVRHANVVVEEGEEGCPAGADAEMAPAGEAPIDHALHEADTRRGARDVAHGGQGAIEHDDDLGSDLRARCVPAAGPRGRRPGGSPATPSG